MKSILKRLYNITHDLLFDYMDYHPFFSKKSNGHKIRQGFISEEHLRNPALDEMLMADLEKSGIKTEKFSIDVQGYKNYIAEAAYPKNYYGGGFDPANNFTEKTLEHFVSFTFLNLSPGKLLIDVAAATSPFFLIAAQKYQLGNAYQQDLVYPNGIYGHKIGGYAHEIPMEPNTVDAVSLHCSLEHFEKNSDTQFFQTLERILKPGGRCVVLPFYIAGIYTMHIDPAFNLLKNHHPILDPLAETRYCKWKQYQSRHYDTAALHKRILDNCPSLKLTVYQVLNFKDVSSSCYLRFVGVFEKVQ